MKKICITIAITLFLLSNLSAQIVDTMSVERKDALDLYIDCDYCDTDYLKKNITLVNYVRDRKAADVHLIITTMTTGGNGTEYTLSFIGLNKFKTLNDTMKISVPPNSTDEFIRTTLAETVKRGLTPFILKTAYSDNIQITFNPIGNSEELVEDKWRSWVLSSSVSGNINGEASYEYFNIWSNLRASKVTDDIKLSFSYNNNFTRTTYRFDTDTLVSDMKSNYGNILITKSLGEHFALGGFVNLTNSTYSNIAFSVSVLPAIEYNFFNYSDATTKQLRFLYRIGYKHNAYIDTTIFDKIQENLSEQRLSLVLKLVRQWGTIETSVFGSNYLHDFSKNKIGMDINCDVQLFKGFSLYVYGGYTQNRSQIALPKVELTNEEILLRRKEMASNYNYWASIGFSYTIGSIYNNVVNPRFSE